MERIPYATIDNTNIVRKKRLLNSKAAAIQKDDIATPILPSASPTQYTRFTIQSRGRNVALKPLIEAKRTPRKSQSTRSRISKTAPKTPTPPILRNRNTIFGPARSKSSELQDNEEDHTDLLFQSEIDMLKSQISLLKAKVVREKSKRRQVMAENSRQKEAIDDFQIHIRDLIALTQDTLSQLQDYSNYANQSSIDLSKTHFLAKISEISVRIPGITAVIDTPTFKDKYHKRSTDGYSFSSLIDQQKDMMPMGIGEFQNTVSQGSQYFTMNDTFSSAQELAKEVAETNNLV